MLKVLNVVGARPQIIKAAAISRAIKNSFLNHIQDIIIHTGQHYDHNMSKVFFEEMDIPEPHINLNVGSSSHGKQTAEIINGIEKIIFDIKPNCIILYGDTNSTLAASIAASKLHVPIIHIEAGLRSFNKSMPEEINRIVCDHVSTLLFSPTKTAIKNLQKEGFKINNAPQYSIDNPGIFHCGDIMYDNSIYYSKETKRISNILNKNNLIPNNYILLTIHRDSNTDNPYRLTNIFYSINKISTNYNIDFIIPLHPRTLKSINNNIKPELLNSLYRNKFTKIIEPVSYLDMIMLEKNAKLVMTDSGGLQKEAYFFKKPCIILRSETEWIELVEAGTALITDVDIKKIIDAFNFLNLNLKNLQFPSLFGNGDASSYICSKIIEHIK